MTEEQIKIIEKKKKQIFEIFQDSNLAIFETKMILRAVIDEINATATLQSMQISMNLPRKSTTLYNVAG